MLRCALRLRYQSGQTVRFQNKATMCDYFDR